MTDNTSPRNDAATAWEVILDPDAHDKADVTALFQRGYDTWTDDDGRDERQMLADIQEFVLRAIEEPDRAAVVEDPLVGPDQPGRLAVMTALGSLMITHNDRLRRESRRITLHQYVHELFADHVYMALNRFSDSQRLQLAAGRTLYGRDQSDDRGPPPGEPVTGIRRVEGDLYFEVPMVHANRTCLAREGDPLEGELVVKVRDNCVYVPVSDFYDRFDDHLVGKYGAAAYLARAMRATLDDNQLGQVVANATEVDEKIEKLMEARQTEKLFADRRYPEKLEVIMRAVKRAPSDEARLGEWHRAKELYEALERLEGDTDNEWERSVAREISSPRSLANVVQRHEDHDHVDLERDRQYNQYRLEYAPGEFKHVEVTEIEDILELPCMRNIHEYLLEEKPVRWVLYTYVRVIFSLSNDFDVEDIVEWFSQYPWFDEATTRYQARYEKERRMPDGSKPMPIGCNNDNRTFSQFCIGKENCEYSIYGSLTFKDEVMDQLRS